MESRCLSHPAHFYLQYCLRLLKLVVQCQHIVQDETPPNSHFLKLALFHYVQEKGMPTTRHDIAPYVHGIYRKLRNTSWHWKIDYFIAYSHMNSPPMCLSPELMDIMKRKKCSGFLFHDCKLL